MDIVAFEHLNAAQRADCARILREAFSHISAYQEDGEAEAEVEPEVEPVRVVLGERTQRGALHK